jgi:alkaline phosphatase D
VNNSVRKNFAPCIAYILSLLSMVSYAPAADFQSKLPTENQRIWIGPEYWSNPLQDWQLNKGQIECVVSGGDRNVFLLTHELTDKSGTFNMSVKLGRLDDSDEKLDEGWVGFKIGVRGQFNDYRDSAVRGDGFRVGLYTDGRLFIGKLDESVEKIVSPLQNITLNLKAEPAGDNYKVTLQASDAAGKELSQVQRDDINPDWLVGGVALACSNGKVTDMPDTRPGIDDGNWGSRSGTNRGGNVRFWFVDWKISGDKVKAYSDRVFGPILFSQYTLGNGILKLTAQMPPIGLKDGQEVILQTKPEGTDTWKTVGTAKIDPLARTATFRVDKFDAALNVPYRLIYKLLVSPNQLKRFYFPGTIRKEPWDKDEFVVAAFTGNNDLGFPNNDFVKSVAWHDPDFLFFSGDQIYEGVGGYGIQVKPLEKAAVDYLRKWYLYGWAYRDLLRNRPAVSIPDDHDVYHGNIWGAGGKATPPGKSGAAAQDTGGYKMPPEWVNMVQRTQTFHMPDPFDPTPVEQGIGVYYTDIKYAGISFAVIEDRKFKSAPAPLLPDAKISNGWPQNPDFDAKKQADIPNAVLLGERQLKFLNKWSTDWSRKTWMKVVLSQTIFANVATLPAQEMSDAAVPQLRILKADEYPPDDKPVSDFDSNGWPQTRRNQALREIRRGFGFHIAGDQHLGSTIQYGIDDWRDGGFAFCVPAVSNVWPRRWCPDTPGLNRSPDSARYAGDFEDGFGNKMTVHAVSNPVFTGKKPTRLYDRATGYGIVRFNRRNRNITIECWPRSSDPSSPDDKQYPGWPITIQQTDNYNRKAVAYLPTLYFVGRITDPVVQVIDDADSEIVYTLRVKGNTFRPMVFKEGAYNIRMGNPDTGQVKTWLGVNSLKPEVNKFIDVEF